MEYRRLGQCGIKVSSLSYGAWVSFGNQLGVDHAKGIMAAARDAGVNFWDNAEVYAKGQAEELMGQAFKELGWKRSDHVVSTKLFWGGDGPNDVGLSRKHIVEGMRASLKRLQMDYVDVVFCHRPDPNTPLEETVRAMSWLVDNGYAFYWGTSEWPAPMIAQAVAIARELGCVPPQVEQPEYNLFHREKVEKEFLPLYSTPSGLGLTTWSPLASGVLTGKYSGGSVPPGSRLAVELYKGLAQKKLVEKRDELEKADALKPIAQELGCSLAQLALAWCVSNPHVSTVITGATRVEQVKENMAALAVVPKMSEAVKARIDDIVLRDNSPADA
uniref:NADP-dependent oxidoreductase domain-containing protein n=1 Tax=Chlamydomonas leiostraca TaxID=1034604 RepID=A0A7S0S156_9CHLO